MDVIRIGRGQTIVDFSSTGAFAAPIASWSGEGHVYRVEFDAGGAIGRHRAGFDQLFCVIDGSGWVEGNDGVRVPFATGDVARIRRGEVHAKGSDAGMAAIMIQLDDFGFDAAVQPDD